MLRVGIVGLGGISRAHGDAIETLPDVEIVAAADLLEAPRREFCDRYEVPRAYPNHTELLKDDEVDAVAVTLGHQLHHRLTVDALNAGKHVLVAVVLGHQLEKPMALSLAQCDDMIEAARRNGVKLMVGQTQHFLGPNRKAKEILDSGELGPLVTAICYSVKNWGYANRRPQYRSRFHGGGHHRLTVDACNAGKHVLVEKPMALSLEQCDDMIEAAASNNVKLMVGQTVHFSGPTLKVKEILDSGCGWPTASTSSTASPG
jgi:predicted dehydrogenase